MATIIDRQPDYVLTRKQFEKLEKNGELVIGSTYRIIDDPSTLDLVDGVFAVKRSKEDEQGNDIIVTYRRKDDSYSKEEVNIQIEQAKVTKVSELENDANYATEEYVEQNGGKIDSISVNGINQPIVDKNVNINLSDYISGETLVDNVTTSLKNNKIQTIGITNGTDVIDYETIFKAITIERS